MCSAKIELKKCLILSVCLLPMAILAFKRCRYTNKMRAMKLITPNATSNSTTMIYLKMVKIKLFFIFATIFPPRSISTKRINEQDTHTRFEWIFGFRLILMNRK